MAIRTLNISFFRILLFTILTVFSSATFAQVNVTLNIAPPYPVHLEDILLFRSQSVITVTNTTSSPLQIKLLAHISGDNGVDGKVKPAFLPLSPLLLQGFETKVLTGAQLRSLNLNLTENDVDISGIDLAQLAQTETMPEGMYQVCIRAHDYNTAAPLSPEMSGCAMVVITHYDPPVIITPGMDEYVTPHQPQFLNFTWTPSGQGGISRYKLELVDMSLNNLSNINDAFDQPGILPFFTKDNLIASVLPYDMSMPQLQAGHQYAVRVTAYDPQKKIIFKNYGQSPVSGFYYQAPGGGNQDPDDPDPDNNLPDPMDGACVAAVDYNGPMGPMQNQAGLPDGTNIQVGKFVMKNTVFSANGATYSGTGTILVNFLNTKMNVEFSNIQINADHRMIQGQINAKVDAQSMVSDAMSKDKNGVLTALPDPAQFDDYISQANRLASVLNP
ncbi:MAG: hypothetical protein IPL65_19655 [Lewinellaceae bacterium]|nr:hypothetical protein [Lewinellaceae bacterium]